MLVCGTAGRGRPDAMVAIRSEGAESRSMTDQTLALPAAAAYE